MAILTFVIPVRHPENAANWQALKGRLAEALRSISAQTDADWEGVVVANRGSDLPPMPQRFRVEAVDFPPNPLHEMTEDARERVYEAFRLDKGRRVLAGMLSMRSSQYFMICDDDDFVSNRLAGFVREHAGQPGWTLAQGYVWSEGSRFVYIADNFAKLCGTSHIVRADLYGLPASMAEASEDYMKRRLGSHVSIDDDLRAAGAPLDNLPFQGAVYRIGHAGAHSKSTGLLRSYVLQKGFLKHPRRLVRNLSRFRRIDDRIGREFFGR
ncbi:glycosyltransferase family A protein [Aureimonas leprariae]|uniref:Glycosyltransferase family 2 protein n=1 Tax=Plantimonas leprariae TaxID=2615207 RepID=A0A7V7TZ66_9HYPH|nr:glycosyltransferase family A protein [Aureimonas leprariae]KAB0678860.1 glycosyltransferase family 2 protein [Aureimonas leprariae]